MEIAIINDETIILFILQIFMKIVAIITIAMKKSEKNNKEKK